MQRDTFSLMISNLFASHDMCGNPKCKMNFNGNLIAIGEFQKISGASAKAQKHFLETGRGY